MLSRPTCFQERLACFQERSRVLSGTPARAIGNANTCYRERREPAKPRRIRVFLARQATLTSLTSFNSLTRCGQPAKPPNPARRFAPPGLPPHRRPASQGRAVKTAQTGDGMGQLEDSTGDAASAADTSSTAGNVLGAAAPSWRWEARPSSSAGPAPAPAPASLRRSAACSRQPAMRTGVRWRAF